MNIKPNISIIPSNLQEMIDTFEIDYFTPKDNLVGTFIARTIELKLAGNDEVQLPAEIKISIGIDNEEKINQPTFVISSITKNTDSHEIVIKGFDYSIKFDEKYDLTLQYPLTLGELALMICNKIGISIENLQFDNHDFIMQQPKIDDKYTYREIIGMIASAMGGIAFINNNDKLEFKKLTNSNFQVDNVFEELINTEKIGPINYVALAREPIQDAIKLDDQNSISTYGKTEVRIVNNYLVDDNREGAITKIFNNLKGFEFYASEITTYQGYKVNPFDIVEVDGKKLLITNINIKFPMLLDGMIGSNQFTKVETKYNSAKGLEKRIINAEASVNKITGEISLVSQSIVEVEKEITEIDGKVDTGMSNLDNKINTEVSNLDNKISTETTKLDTKINNEVSGLQAQIDGAIQFWNGEEIPTLNNEPAKDWTTEEIRNNHRADIYTVIEDVDGELKQGKSYRFDKVGNNWVWVELTDNELSAVQALAQSKAKVFVSTPKPPYNVGDLWLKDKELYECIVAKDANGTYAVADWQKATKYTDDTVALLAQATADTAINNQTITGTTEEGKTFHLTDSADNNCKSVEIFGESTQVTETMPSPEFSSEIQSVSGSLEIKVVGKNFLNISSVYELNQYEYNIPLSLKVGTYLLSAKSIVTTGSQKSLIVFKNADGENVNVYLSSIELNATITFEKDIVSYSIYSQNNYANSTGIVTTFNELMLSKSGGDYEPYKESITAIPLLHDMRSLPNGVRDRIYYSNGKWYDEQNVGQIILDGSENWSGYSQLTDVSRAYYIMSGIKANGYLRSNYFVRTLYESNDVGITLTPYTASMIAIKIPNNVLSSLDITGIKTWLSTHNTEVIYELAEPIITEITNPEIINALENIKTFKNTTHITADAPSILTYYRDVPMVEEYETIANANKKYKITTEKFAEQEITNTSIKSSVTEVNTKISNDLATKNELSTEIAQVNNAVDIKIEEKEAQIQEVDGKINTLSEKVTNMNYSFGTQGLRVATNKDANNSLLDNSGIRVYNYNDLQAIFNYKGSGIDKLIVTGTAQIGYLRAVKSTKDGKKVTKIFHLEQLIENLKDLEVN